MSAGRYIQNATRLTVNECCSRFNSGFAFDLLFSNTKVLKKNELDHQDGVYTLALGVSPLQAGGDI